MNPLPAFKKILMAFVWITAIVPVYAQVNVPAGPSFWDDPFAHPLLPFYTLMFFIFLVALLVLVMAGYLVRVLNIFLRQAAEEKAAQAGVSYIPEKSWWSKMMSGLTDSVPVEKEETVMLDHNYDGIRELDNHLPPWWKWLFYATIAWSAVYLLVYHVWDAAPLMEEEYQIELATAEKAKPAAPPTDETTIALSTDVVVLQRGKDLFLSNCASCHKTDGGGDIGPNLTDEYWIHGGSIQDVFRIVSEGVTGTNMIPWKGILSPDKIGDVSNFVMSLNGTTPEKSKEPQGERYQPSDEVPETDTVSVGVEKQALLK